MSTPPLYVYPTSICPPHLYMSTPPLYVYPTSICLPHLYMSTPPLYVYPTSIKEYIQCKPLLCVLCFDTYKIDRVHQLALYLSPRCGGVMHALWLFIQEEESGVVFATRARCYPCQTRGNLAGLRVYDIVSSEGLDPW